MREREREQEGNALFIDALNTFYYGYMALYRTTQQERKPAAAI